MPDRELLEASARAAGLALHARSIGEALVLAGPGGVAGAAWNPLADDGDALRLAVHLRLRLLFHELAGGSARVERMLPWADFTEVSRGDEQSAMRRAIVRAAASMAAK